MTEMTEICDPWAGWHGIHHKWTHCRGEACLTIELLSVGKDAASEYAYVGVDPSWHGKEAAYVDKGEYIEYKGEYIEYLDRYETVWRVYCDGVSTSQNLASIRICYEEVDEEEVDEPDTPPAIGNAYEMGVGDTVLDISLVRIICATSQAIIEYGGKENTIGHVMKALITNPFRYVGIWWIDKACTKAYIVRADTTITPEAEQTIKAEAQEAHPTATPEEIDEAYDWAKEQAARDTRWQELLEQYRTGSITYDEMIAGQLAIAKEYMNSRLSTKDFTLSIPTLCMAGEIAVSGTAPQPNQELQICATKKFFGFDFLAADEVLTTVTSDAEYNYEATLILDEFGIIEVYARIPKGWWDVLTDDIKTAKHMVFVFTWEIVIFLIIAAALVYDSKTGKIELLKKKR